MGKENEGMPFVPEEDLDLHQNFQPIIAENGIIRPKKQEIPVDLTVSPDTTFTRMDTVQDLVQIRSAEQRAKEEVHKKQEEPIAPASEVQQPDSLAQMQTVSAESFVPGVSAKPEAPAKPTKPEESFYSLKNDLASSELPPDLPTIPFEKSIFKKRKSKKERRKLRTFFKKKESDKKKEDTQLLTQRQPAALLPAPDPTAVTAPAPVTDAALAPKPKKRRSWWGVLAILCLLFLGTISGVVPVEKIPLLRNIAYAMGFTKDDTSRMSFLRALLTWTDKTIGARGQQEGEDVQSARWTALERLRMRGNNPAANDEDDLGSIYARMQRESGKTSLIDINALNKLQRQKGYKVDSIRSSMPLGSDENPDAVLRDDDVNVRTEANRDTKGEVFFGSDISGVSRNSQDGFNSVDAFKKVTNPHIAGVNSTDWIVNTAKNMMKTDMGLGGVNKEFGAVQLNWETNINDVGKNKEHRDLYHAWIASRMSKYTTNLMVKKALADTGFMGAEVPTTASSVVGYGGIQLDTDALKEDQEAWAEYLEFEKQCKEALGAHSDKIDKAVGSFNAIVERGAEQLGYPSNCFLALQMTEPPSTFTTNTSTIQQVCQELDVGYKALRDACNMEISATTIACDSLSDSYNSSFESFKQGCQNEYEQRKKSWEDKWKLDHPNEILPPNKYHDEQWPQEGKTITSVTVGGGEFGSAAVFAQIQNDGGKFTTWIRAHCEEDASGHMNCIPVDESGVEDYTQINNVRGTIGGSMLKP